MGIITFIFNNNKMQTKHKKKSRVLEPIPSQHGEHMIMLSITKKKKDSIMDDEDYIREMDTPECSSSDDESYQKKYREILDSKKESLQSSLRTQFLNPIKRYFQPK